MAKFRMKLKLQGLELEIEGAREDASLISRNIGQQMAGLLQPAGAIVDGDVLNDETPPVQIINASNGTSPKKIRRRKQASTAQNDDDSSAAVDFKHEPQKYGNPRQEWKTAQKAVWLIYVVKEVTGIAEMTTRSIVETFNKHFRQSGTITTSNTSRDLGRLKAKEKPSPVGEDTTKTPAPWYLTEEGRKRAQELVGEALGQPGLI